MFLLLLIGKTLTRYWYLSYVAHATPMAGHLGANETCDRIFSHFYWLWVKKYVIKSCKPCHTCQLVGMPNQKIPIASLKPIPIFSKLLLE